MGTPDDMIARLQGYAAAGVEEIMLQWWGPSDEDGLRMLAEEVVPYV